MTTNEPTEAPAPRATTQVAKAVVLVAIAWTWVLLPWFGEPGVLAAIAAPPIFAAIIVAHAVALVARRRLLVLISALAWLASATVMVVAPRTPTHFAAPRDPVTVVAANLQYNNRTPEEAVRAVLARRADVVVISEGILRTEAIVARAYAYHVRSRFNGNPYSELVASRYPLRIRPAPSELLQAVVVEVMAPTPFVLVGVHLPAAGIDLPYAHGTVSFATQMRAVRAVTAITSRSTLPVVVAGDLNVSDRTAAYGKLVAHRRDAMRARWAGSTYRPFPWSLLALRIDHVLIDHTWCAAHPRRFHPAGSDHNAVQVSIGPCPSA